MFEKVLSKSAKQSLALLGKGAILKGAYLAGGTALALHLGHRYSYDFDFFMPQEFDEEIMVQRIIKLFPKFKLERKSRGTILGYIGEIRFSMFHYNYPLLFSAHQFFGIDIAAIKDIAPMKIAAIADRGTKRDFIDLYFIFEVEKILTLKEALKLYDKKFETLKQNKVHILKSLVYFEDAEKDPIPRMIKPISWATVKKFFISGQKTIVKEMLGI